MFCEFFLGCLRATTVIFIFTFLYLFSDISFLTRLQLKARYLLQIIKRIGHRKVGILCFSLFRDFIYRKCGGTTTALRSTRIKNKKYYILRYTHNWNTYQILWKAQFGPSKILKIVDQNGDDVTQYVRQFLGPDDRCHGCLISPEMMNLQRIKIMDIFGSERIFEGPNLIII